MFVSPMLLERINTPFDSDEYITELKLDGIRLLLTKFDNKFRLFTRHNNDVTYIFSEILEGFNIPNGTILDGEIIVPDKDGKPDFEAVMQRFKSKKANHNLQYCVFDMIYYKDKNVSHLPLLERKKLLAELPFPTNKIVPVQWMIGNGPAYFNLIIENDLEGIVLKKSDSKYQINKRTNQWLKVINYKYTDVFITGIIKKDHSFLLSSLDRSPIGVMEFVPSKERKKIHSLSSKDIKSEDDKIIYLEQGIKCNVKFRNWTKNNKLRIPSFHQWS